jgi:hypothetical protein
MDVCEEVAIMLVLALNSMQLTNIILKKTITRVFNLFLILDCEAIGTAATPGLLCQPLVIMKMIVEK